MICPGIKICYHFFNDPDVLLETKDEYLHSSNSSCNYSKKDSPHKKVFRRQVIQSYLLGYTIQFNRYGLSTSVFGSQVELTGNPCM